MQFIKRTRLEELKVQAKILHKNLLSTDYSKSHKAAFRFTRLPLFSGKTPEEVLLHSGEIKLKHAYSVLAFEHGFSGWDEMKNRIVAEDCLLSPQLINSGIIWFSDYRKALIYFRKNGGYLLQYRDEFFVANRQYIEKLHLHPEDPDWTRIG
jgi:hypothetical protein